MGGIYLDRTFREIHEALATRPVIIHLVSTPDEGLTLIADDFIVGRVCPDEDETGAIIYQVWSNEMVGQYETSDFDGYPIFNIESETTGK